MQRSTSGSTRSTRVMRSLLILVLGMSSVGALGVLAPSSASAEEVAVAAVTPGDPFDPLVPKVFVAQDRPKTTLFSGQQTPGHLSLVAQGATTGVSYNAIGFNPDDNFIYGIKAVPNLDDFGTNNLVRVGEGGVVTDLGPVAGLPVPTGKSGNSYTQGAFGDLSLSDKKQVLYVRDYNNAANNKVMWSIDVTQTPLRAVKINIQMLNPGLEDLADFTWNGTSLWGVSPTKIYEIVPTGPTTALATDYPINIPQMRNRHFGAAWTYGNGNMGFADNQTGNMFQVAATPVNGTMGFRLITEFQGPSSNNNDGTNIVGDPVDLAIVKDGPVNYALNGVMNYTMTVTNNGPGMSSGSVLTDVPPAELTNIATTTPGCSVSGGSLNCVLGALAVGASTVVNMSAKVVPAITDYQKRIINRADVLGNEVDPNIDNNWDDTASRRVAGVLGVVKSSDPVSGTQVRPGQLVNYTLTFANTGDTPVAVDEIDHLTDVLDDAAREGAIVAQAPLSAIDLPAGGQIAGIAITGNLLPNTTATVKYSVRVKSVLPTTASGKLGNFVVANGDTPPLSCVATTKRCTDHPVRVSLSWNKVNDRTPAQFLAGSEWTLTPYDRAAVPVLDPSTLISVVDCVAASAAECAGPDSNPAVGKFTVADLTIGKYRLTETKAPAGYLRITPIDIDVFSVLDYGNIVNRQAPVPTLPLTGGMGTAVFWGSTGGLGLLAAVALVLQRRRIRLAGLRRVGA